MRNSEVVRKTAETDIRVSLEIDGGGKCSIDTGCGFLDHMLRLFASHGRFDLEVLCRGDTEVDYHHTTEDVAVCLGSAFARALADKRGICRYADIVLAMDEALVMCAVDISGRAYLSYSLDVPTEKVGDFDCELVREFFCAFVRSAGITLHIRKLGGENSHHIIEGAFKGFARVMRKAAEYDDRYRGEIPSTKGVV